MGDAEAEGALPGDAPTEGGSDAREKIADGVDQNAKASNETAGNTAEHSATAIDNEAPAGDAQNEDNETPGAVDNVEEGVLDTAETNGEENGVEKAAPEDGTNGIGAGAESGVEGADGVDIDNVYRRVRELALEAINAVRAAWSMVLKR